MAEKQRKRAPIIATRYHKRKTGEKDFKGHNEWETLRKDKWETEFDTFAELKRYQYEKSMSHDDFFVNYYPRRIKSVTQKLPDGTKVVTFFGRERNNVGGKKK